MIVLVARRLNPKQDYSFGVSSLPQCGGTPQWEPHCGLRLCESAQTPLLNLVVLIEAKIDGMTDDKFESKNITNMENSESTCYQN
jgi:hypothetical protein